jgi:hypothetical protein
MILLSLFITIYIDKDVWFSVCSAAQKLAQGLLIFNKNN